MGIGYGGGGVVQPGGLRRLLLHGNVLKNHKLEEAVL